MFFNSTLARRYAAIAQMHADGLVAAVSGDAATPSPPELFDLYRNAVGKGESH